MIHVGSSDTHTPHVLQYSMIISILSELITVNVAEFSFGVDTVDAQEFESFIHPYSSV